MTTLSKTLILLFWNQGAIATVTASLKNKKEKGMFVKEGMALDLKTVLLPRTSVQILRM